MVPGGAVVSGPGGGVALAPGVAGAGEDEGTDFGVEGEEAFVGAAGVLHAEDVVDFEVGGGAGFEAGFGDAVLDVVGHGFGGDVEDGGLVHVVPEACDAFIGELFVEGAPPFAGDLAGEVGEDGWAGPDDSGVGGAVWIFDEVVADGAGVVGGVAGVGEVGDVEVGDGDDVEVLGGKVGDHLGEVREGLGVYGEGAVVVLVVDVEVEGVGGDVVGAEGVGDGVDFGLRHIAVAGLLEAEGPEGWEGCGAGEPGVGFDDVFGGGAVEEVVVYGAVGSAEGVLVGVFAAKVEEGAPGVVEEDAESGAGAEVDEEGNAFVDGIGGFLPAEVVGVPHGEGFADAVEWTGLVAEAEEVGVDGFRLMDVEGGALPVDGAVVLLEDFAGEIGDGEAEVFGEVDAEGCGVESFGVWGDGDGGGAGGRQDGPRGILGERGVVAGADA